MAETLAQTIVDFFKGTIPPELTVFIVSLMPILEIRGGMIAAKLLDVNLISAFFISYLGNMVPIPFIILFIRQIFTFLRRFKFFEKIILKLEAKTEKNKDKILKYEQWGLLIFVAIPLPGTGGWTGALMAALLDIPMKKSFPIIALGVLIAGFIMTLLTYGLFWFA
ncbi:MAG: small multi-drug export protein [Oscillospiraceae bacterium]